MALIISDYAAPKLTPVTLRIRTDILVGSLRIGGDSPNGLVLVSGVPASRPVWILDMETGVVVAQTNSDTDGTYNVPFLSARTDGYAVWIRGVNPGERDYFIPGVHPG